MKLRYTPEEICREAAQYFLGKNKKPWTQVNDGYWYQEHPEYARILKEKYIKDTDPNRSAYEVGSKKVVRVAACKDGYMVIVEESHLNIKHLTHSSKNLKLIQEGYVYQIYPATTQTKLFVKNNGIVSLGVRQIKRYLSFSMIGWFYDYLGQDITRKLFMIQDHLGWLEPHFPNVSVSVSMEDFRKSKSLQDLLDKINTTDLPLQESYFKDMPLNRILSRIIVATFLQNPLDYLLDPPNDRGSGDDPKLTDAINNARLTGNKVFYHPGKFLITKQEDREHLELLF